MDQVIPTITRALTDVVRRSTSDTFRTSALGCLQVIQVPFLLSIRLMRVSFQPIKMTGSWMYMTGSWKEATLHKADIWTILGKNN